jgi:hypothetical protein
MARVMLEGSGAGKLQVLVVSAKAASLRYSTLLAITENRAAKTGLDGCLRAL